MISDGLTEFSTVCKKFLLWIKMLKFEDLPACNTCVADKDVYNYDQEGMSAIQL